MNKKLVFFRTLALIAIIGLAFACKKDDNGSSATAKSYIEVQNGEFVSGALPAESGTGISAVITANTRALEGGSSPINITSVSDFSDLLIGIQGTSGYFQVPIADLDTADGRYTAIILFENDLPREEFTIITELINQATNEVGGRTLIEVSTLEQSSAAKMQISLSWDLLNDIDLHLVEPNGNEIYFGNEGGLNYDWDQLYIDHPDDWDMLTPDQMSEYILDDEVTTGVLDLDSNPGCWIDSVNNENIIYIFPSDIQVGEYIVRVDFYSDCVWAGTTNYIVTARYDNELMATSSGNNPYYGSFEAGTDDSGGAGSGVEVMRFNLTEIKSADNTQRIYLEKPRQVNAAKKSKIKQAFDNNK